jgi:CRISPR-associated endonuclease/helicase Cas3
MTLTRSDFAGFFASAHGGHQPYPWQERLLDAVLTEGRWPDQIVAPTGAGKTAAIDVHVFAQAMTAEDPPAERPPRRLALVVGRRVLVDDQYEYARRLAEILRVPDAQDERSWILREVSERLWHLHRPASETDDRSECPRPVSPLVVARLRGGLPPSRAWREDPTAVEVLCATPDMWGSRLLFRGYGATSLAWPREAGLLAFDTVAVVDEAHLSRQLLCTARRVGELATVAEHPLPVRPLQVVETTATPAEEGTDQDDRLRLVSVAVEQEDLADDGLSARLTRPKSVTLLPVPDWASPRAPHRRNTAAAMADSVLKLLEVPTTTDSPGTAAAPAHTVGCFVNTVTRAVDVATVLRSRSLGDRPLNVVVVCGQIRPHDLDRLRTTYPGVLEPAGNPEVDVIVGTQSLEVGVDLDLAGMVTELATGSALAQRVGRVNRRGIRERGAITVVVPEEPVTGKIRSGPYEPEELQDALEWLQERVMAPDGLAPWALREAQPPSARPRRPLHQRPELADAWHWARTSDDLAADPELDLWLAEDFDDDTSVGLVVRHAMPDESADAIRFVSDLPPQRHETFSVPYRTAREALITYQNQRRAAQQEAPGPIPEIVVVRGEETRPLRWRMTEDRETPLIRPGDVIVVDDTVELFTQTGSPDRPGFSPPVVIPATEETPPAGSPTDDVLMAQPDLGDSIWSPRRRGGVVLRIEDGLVADERSFAALADLLIEAQDAEEQDPESRQRTVVRDWLTSAAVRGHQEMVASAVGLLEDSLRPGGHRLCELHVHKNAEDRPCRVILLDRRRPAVDEDLRQVWTRAKIPVTLDAHQQAVADRVGLLSAKLSLSPRTRRELTLAAAHHDDGKRDPRFQVRLGNPGGTLLAKSPPGTTRERTRRNAKRSGLPSTWRHEQLSVVEAWPLLDVAGHTADGRGTRAEGETSAIAPGDSVHFAVDVALVVRLIGASHGHGRIGFPHTAEELLQPQDDESMRELARDLFDRGTWDDLVERTHRRYGVWGCAYLEALLRAADGQISEEGS